jgi:enoyl-[acyl-carrier protein] reductase II
LRLAVKTAITELLGIDMPILLPGMSWISTPELVAAVSNAGGLGILATGPLTPAETKDAIAQVRQLTDKPFGIGITLLMPGAEANADIAIAAKVPVINFSLGKGDKLIERAHAYGAKVIATVVTEKHALSAQKSGADALLVTGHEAAAHGGDVTSLILVPAISQAVDIPVIATGGFADGRGLMAAFSLGADAIAMGSRLATSADSPLHRNMKDAVIKKTEQDTIYSKNFDGIHARVMRTPEAIKATKKPMNFIMACIEAMKAAAMVKQPIWKVLLGMLAMVDKVKLLAYFGAAVPRLKAATVDGDYNKGVQFIGQAQGLIKDQPSVQQIFDGIREQAVQVQNNNDQLLNR